ncbi:MAG: YwqG family protein [Planctomycetota bacterium]
MDLPTTRADAVARVRASRVADHADAIIDALEPSAVLARRRAAEGEELPLGASRLGGLPDLPRSIQWPTQRFTERVGLFKKRDVVREGPLDFLAQIRCEDVPKGSVPGAFPDHGVLYAFYDAVHVPWDVPACDGREALLLHCVDVDDLVRREPPDPGRPTFPACVVEVTPGWTLPDEDLPLPAADEDACEAYFEELLPRVQGREEEPSHRLFGEAQWIQSNALESHPGERLLLQIDSDSGKDGPGWMWGDAGTLYFLIHDADLGAGRFSLARLVLQCY